MGKPRTEWQGPFQSDIIKKITPSVLKYIKWYCENGIYLPEKFSADPATYTQRLRDIQYALEVIQEKQIPISDNDKKMIATGQKYLWEHFGDLFK